MKRIFSFIIAVSSVLFAVSCEKEPEQTETPEVSFDIEVPAALKTYAGAEVTFKCAEGKGLATTDKLIFKSGNSSIECQIIKASSKDFTFIVAEGLTTSSYFIWVERGSVSKKIGTISLTIADKSDIPDTDYNLYGKVTASGQPLEGVVVSDGHITTLTGKDGMYYLKSQKKRGYVFISVPSGYEVSSTGVLPDFHKKIKKDELEVVQADFSLMPVSGQDQHIMYVLGDLHLAARNDDLKQFDMFADDLNEQIKANQSRRQYIMTLGDMTWDIYWGNYNFNRYVNTMNSSFEDIQVFHTIGNHDHDVDAEGDFNTVLEYFNYLGPNYYSFNIGRIHYVILDDILCKNTGAGTSESRYYANEVDEEQLEWLKADLGYVDPSMTVVVASHAPMYSPSGAGTFNAALNNLSDLMACFSKFRNVHYFTGHTHDVYNVDKLSSANPHFEHNTGAVCATWWWTYTTCQMNLARDGAPGGYTICDFDGADFEWIFKAYDRDLDYQFRAYDMNNVNSSEFPKGYDTYSTTPANSVLINIWNWDPSWTLSVTENGKELNWKQIYDYDPLHVLGYTKVRGINTTSSFLSKKTPHLFMVQASSADSTLDIRVTDRFGNVYDESMSRPREFTVEVYK